MLDFLNDTDAIAKAFSNYYRTTILAEETDPNKLHDLQSDLDGAQVYSPDQVREFVKRYLDGVERDQLDPILDRCVEVYRTANWSEDEQVAFKSGAKAFRADLRLPLLDSLLQQPGLGGTLDLPQLPHPQAAVAGGG